MKTDDVNKTNQSKVIENKQQPKELHETLSLSHTIWETSVAGLVGQKDNHASYASP